jgi:hypothetical protein
LIQSKIGAAEGYLIEQIRQKSNDYFFMNVEGVLPVNDLNTLIKCD